MNTAAQRECSLDPVAYRYAFRRYLRDLDVAQHWRTARFSSIESTFEHDAARMRRLHTDGWNRFGWPEWAGGFGGTEEHRMAYLDELVQARIPQPLQHRSVEQFAPVLIEYAPELAAKCLPRYLQGEEHWATNAIGSARRDGRSWSALSATPDGEDALVLVGPQTWSYIGPPPTKLVLVARTDPSVCNSAATAFLVDADALAPTIRKRAAAGSSHDIVEIAIDRHRVVGADVVAPQAADAVAQRLSEEPRGLHCYTVLCDILFDLTLLREAMAEHGSSQGQRQRFAQVYVDVVSAQARSSAMIRAQAQVPAQSAQPADDVEGILLRRARERVSDLILDVGRSRIIRGTISGGASLVSARADWWYSRAANNPHLAHHGRDTTRQCHSPRKVSASGGDDARNVAWNSVEERVHRAFDELARVQAPVGPNTTEPSVEHADVDVVLADVGWADIEAEFPAEACELLFRAQGRTLAQTNCLSRTMLAELSCIVGDVGGIVLPDVRSGETPKAAHGVSGIVTGPLTGRVAVPVSGPMGTVSVGVVEASRLENKRLDTFDPSAQWTQVSGSLDVPLVEASTEWYRAIAAAQRGLATELVALGDSVLQVVINAYEARATNVDHSCDSAGVCHQVAEVSAILEGARALLAESWHYGGRLSALAAKCAAGRAHRAVSELALTFMGVDSWTRDPLVARSVARGMQLDALCGSHEHLEAVLGERLFEIYGVGQPLPSIFS